MILLLVITLVLIGLLIAGTRSGPTPTEFEVDHHESHYDDFTDR